MRALCIQQELQSAERRLQERQPSVSSISAFANLLQDCIRRKDLSEGESAHSLLVRNGLQENKYLACLLIRMVSACGHLPRASHLFLDVGDQHNVYIWTAIIQAHVQHSYNEQALTYYEHMLFSSVKGIAPTFVAVLKACDGLCNLEKGMLFHVEIAGQGLDGNLYVQSALLNMYANCGCIQDVQSLFDRLPIRDHAMWAVMVQGLIKHDQPQKALALVEEMQNQGLQPNKATILVLLHALSNTKSLTEKECFYSNIVLIGLDSDEHVKSSILNMYFKCHRLIEAFYVFESMSLDRDVVSWNVMIAGVADHGHRVDAFELYKKMKLEKVSPSEATFVSLLKCIANADVGRVVHTDIVMLGLETRLPIEISLINMYAKRHCLMDGRNMLDGILAHDVISWSSMMSGYVEQGQTLQAFELYMSMLHKGIEPDGYTFSCLLQATKTLQFGYLIHADIVEQALESSPFVGNSIINMYCECGSLACAQVVFDLLVTRNAVSFSTLISGYVGNGHQARALLLFLQLWQESAIIDSVTVLCGLKACAHVTDAILIFSAVVEQGFDNEIAIGSALVDLFAILGSLEDSRKAFRMLRTHDMVTYSTLMSGHVKHGHYELALQLSKEMHNEGLKPDAITWVCMLQACSGMGLIKQGQSIHAEVAKQGFELNALLGSAFINMYANFGKVEDARKVFDGLHSRDVVVWSAMISCYVENEKNEEAIELYKEISKGGKLNVITFLCALKACSQLSNLHCGMSIHDDIRREGLEGDASVAIALVDMYCKSGYMKNAINVFKNLKVRDVVLWCTLIAGCADHGLYELVHRHFKSMQDDTVLPDAALWACILKACSHGGLINESLHLFHALLKDKTITQTIEHYICLVDILGRVGCVKEAEDVALKMPFQPTPVVWVSLQSSCVRHSNIDIARQSFAFLDELNCKDVAVGYTLMLNVAKELNCKDVVVGYTLMLNVAKE